MPAAAILAIGWTFAVIYAYPGVTTWDSLSSLIDARNGTYADINPPAVATLWFWAEHLIGGSLALLLLQMGTFLLGAYLVLLRTLSPRAAAWGAAGLLAFPPVLVPMGFIWSEGLMAGFLLLGIGCLLTARRPAHVAGLVALFGACAVRYGAALAVLPAILLLFEWRPRLPAIRRYAIAAGVWIGIAGAAFGTNRALTDHKKSNWHMTVALHDIAGTLASVRPDLPDAELERLLDGTELLVHHHIHKALRAAYSPRTSELVTSHPKYALWHVPSFGYDPLPAPRRAAISRAWSDVVSRYPAAYARHRLSTTSQLLRRSGQREGLVADTRDFNDIELARWMGIATHWSRIQLDLTHAFSTVASSTPLFEPWIYLVLLIAFLVLGRRHRDVVALLASGLGMLLVMVVTAPSRDYRFLHWMVACTCLAGVILAVRRARGIATMPLIEASEPTRRPLRDWVIELPRNAWQRASSMPPAWILAFGLLGLLAYGFPGYMSHDSVVQLLEARAGSYSDGHPPAMAAIWRLLDSIVAGPFLMLVLQVVTFLLGGYLLFRRWMPRRIAAIAACLLLWFPPISSTMAVIWKDSQMCGFLLIGTALVLSVRLDARLAGLGFLALGTAMRHNALTMTFPIVLLLFVWSREHRWWKRYPIAIAAWVAITLSAQVATHQLADRHQDLWGRSLAILDIVGTIRYAEPMPDAQIRDLLDGIRIIPQHHLYEHTQGAYDPNINAAGLLWGTTLRFVVPPDTEAERIAVSRAWKRVVTGHPWAYLQYRWQIFRQLIRLTDVPSGYVTYFWFQNIEDIVGATKSTEHFAVPSVIQDQLRDLMAWFGGTWMFRPYMFILLTFALLPFCFRRIACFAIAGSGLACEVGLYLLTPATEVRYSVWLVICVVINVIVLVAARAGMRPSPADSDPHPQIR